MVDLACGRFSLANVRQLTSTSQLASSLIRTVVGEGADRVGLIRLRGPFPKGGYDAHDGSKRWEATSATVYARESASHPTPHAKAGSSPAACAEVGRE